MVRLKINWEKITSDVLTSIIMVIIGGAGLIVWNGATTVEQKVDAATSSIKLQQDYLGKAVLVIEKEIVELKEKTESINPSIVTPTPIPSAPITQTPMEEKINPVTPDKKTESSNNLDAAPLPPLPTFNSSNNMNKVPNDLIRQQLPAQSSL